eukprot:GILK01012679.1.p1 GENE.GILK01012679.1~~GILK01012679.1.p1  ORF type:complete len:971 (-),score=198.50 GILK01012679.1:313-3192(-)
MAEEAVSRIVVLLQHHTTAAALSELDYSMLNSYLKMFLQLDLDGNAWENLEDNLQIPDMARLLSMTLHQQDSSELAYNALAVLRSISKDMTIRNRIVANGVVLANVVEAFLYGTPQLLPAVLDLWYDLTVRSNVTVHADVLFKALSALVSMVMDGDISVRYSSLGVLANCVRGSPAIRAHVKSLQEVTALYRCLIQMLNHQDPRLLIHALTALTALSIDDPLGEKLFNTTNVHQTFQLVLNLIFDNQSARLLREASDLVSDMVASPRLASLLESYSDISSAMNQLLMLLSNKDKTHVHLSVLQLLTAIFVRCHAIRRVILSICTRQTELVTAIFLLPLRGSADVAVAAVELLLCIIEDDLSVLQSFDISAQSRPIVAELCEVLHTRHLGSAKSDSHSFYNQNQNRTSRQTMSRISAIGRLLSNMARDRSLCKRIADSIQIDKILDLVRNCIPFGSADIVVSLLSLLIRCFDPVPPAVSLVIQDMYVLQLLVSSLVHSTDPQVLHNIITFIQQSLAKGTDIRSKLQLSAFAERLATVNKDAVEQHRELEDRVKSLEEEIVSKQTMLQMNSEQNRQLVQLDSSRRYEIELESLRNKMTMELEAKDRTMNEIKSAFDAEMLEMSARLDQMQELLQAKEAALVRADKMTAEQRNRRSALEAEVNEYKSKLYSLDSQLLQLNQQRGEMQSKLQEALQGREEREKACRLLQQQYEEMTTKEQKTRTEMEDVKQNLTERSDRLEETYKKLILLAKSYQTKETELLECQQEKSSVQNELNRKNEELTSMSQKLREKEKDAANQLSSLQAQMKLIEQRLAAKSLDFERQTEQLSGIRRSLQDTENRERNLYDENAILKKKQAHLEVELTRKEQIIRAKEEELTKHASLIALMHSLSGSSSAIGSTPTPFTGPSTTTTPAMSVPGMQVFQQQAAGSAMSGSPNRNKVESSPYQSGSESPSSLVRRLRMQ